MKEWIEGEEVMSKQSDAEGELTYDPNDKHPHRRKVKMTKTEETFHRRKVKPVRLGALVAGKHLTIFPISERRKGLPLSERSQITIGDYVYKRSRARPGSPLYGKWYKRRKGEREAILVDSPPVEGNRTHARANTSSGPSDRVTSRTAS